MEYLFPWEKSMSIGERVFEVGLESSAHYVVLTIKYMCKRIQFNLRVNDNLNVSENSYSLRIEGSIYHCRKIMNLWEVWEFVA